MKILDDLFELLSDGKTHDIEMLSKQLNLQPHKVRKLCEFLGKYDLVYFTGKHVLIDERVQEFLKEIAKPKRSDVKDWKKAECIHYHSTHTNKLVGIYPICPHYKGDGACDAVPKTIFPEFCDAHGGDGTCHPEANLVEG